MTKQKQEPLRLYSFTDALLCLPMGKLEVIGRMVGLNKDNLYDRTFAGLVAKKIWYEYPEIILILMEEYPEHFKNYTYDIKSKHN